MINNKLNVDLDLIKKYDKPGPRYTSYPTAPYFHEGIGAEDYVQHILKDDAEYGVRDISLYFHLPFCNTLCYFCACNKVITKRTNYIDEYIDYLEKEIKLIRPYISDDRKVAQLHWGGGTPTYLSPDQIRRLGKIIHENFEFTPDAEVGVEIDPRDMTVDRFKALRDAGFNRGSLGAQDFNPEVQEAVNRIQPAEMTRQSMEWAKEFGFESMNIDLMYGLPYQTVDSFSSTLDTLIEMYPDRIAVFNYAHLPDIFKHQRVIKDHMLPSPEAKLQILKKTIEKLTATGYVFIGMDHFAKPDDELSIALEEGTLYRNFQGYSTHSGLNLIALGMTSISMLSELYVQNVKKLNDYYRVLDEGKIPVFRGYELTWDDMLRRKVITELMCNFRVNKKEVEEQFDIDFDDYFDDALENLRAFEEDDLLSVEPDRISVYPQGRLLIRNIAMNFDYYLQKKAGKKPQFSRTV